MPQELTMMTPTLLRRPMSGRSHSSALALIRRRFGTAGSQGFSRQAATAFVCIGGRRQRLAFTLPVAGGIIGQIHHAFHQTTRLSSSSSKNGEGDTKKERNENDGDANNRSNVDQAALGAADEAAIVKEEEVESTATTSCSGSEAAEEDKQEPTPFPWRHESTETPRLLEKDDYSGMPNNFRARFVRRLVSCRELNMTALDAIPIPFFARAWEDELANNFQLAFGMALEKLLTSMFRGKVPVTVDDSCTISIDSSVRNDDDCKKNDHDVMKMEDDEYLNRMLDKDLIAKYSSVDFDSDNLHLKLSIRPIEATLEHIFAIPLLTREIVEKKPHLRGGYLRIEQAFAEKKSFASIKEMTYDLAREVGEDDAYSRTVVADATIECFEFFQIKDAKTGEVVRGMEDGQEEEEVVHNVRFEVVTEKSDDGIVGRKVGNWKIIDIDDFLEGNVFH